MQSHDTITLTGSTEVADPAGEVTIPRELGPVRLLREIGRGGMGVVYLGRHQMLDRDVAVKFLLNAVAGPDDPGFAGFIEGARAAARLEHPGLTTIHHADVVDGIPYLVMQYVDGPALSDVVKQTGPLSLSASFAVLDAVSEAIGELHDRGIIHRDIKPGNVMLGLDGHVVVTDFGLSLARPMGQRGPSSARLGGTPAYMAPEMFAGELSLQSDVYALGVPDVLGREIADGALEAFCLEGELGDPDSARELVSGVDAVVHAALYRPGDRGFRGAEGDMPTFVTRNVLGTVQLIEAARATGAGRFIFISTCAVHEKILDDRRLDEAHPLWPTSHYGAHKAAIEKFIHSYGLGDGYDICSLRPTGIYGLARPVSDSKWYELVQGVKRGHPVASERGGKEVHAADVAKAARRTVNIPRLWGYRLRMELSFGGVRGARCRTGCNEVRSLTQTVKLFAIPAQNAFPRERVGGIMLHWDGVLALDQRHSPSQGEDSVWADHVANSSPSADHVTGADPPYGTTIVSVGPSSVPVDRWTSTRTQSGSLAEFSALPVKESDSELKDKMSLTSSRVAIQRAPRAI